MKVILNNRPHLIWILPQFVFVLASAILSVFLFSIRSTEIKYVASALMILSGFAGVITALYYLGINYKITEDRISFRKGILNVRTKFIELYRVKDLELKEPFFYRFFGLGNIKIYSSDQDLPEFTIYAQKKQLEPLFRKAVEDIRIKKGVREIDTV